MKRVETEYIIHQLRVMDVQNGPSGELFDDMDYQSLVRLLAVKRAVAE